MTLKIQLNPTLNLHNFKFYCVWKFYLSRQKLSLFLWEQPQAFRKLIKDDHEHEKLELEHGIYCTDV